MKLERLLNSKSIVFFLAGMNGRSVKNGKLPSVASILMLNLIGLLLCDTSQISGTQTSQLFLSTCWMARTNAVSSTCPRLLVLWFWNFQFHFWPIKSVVSRPTTEQQDQRSLSFGTLLACLGLKYVENKGHPCTKMRCCSVHAWCHHIDCLS